LDGRDSPYIREIKIIGVGEKIMSKKMEQRDVQKKTPWRIHIEEAVLRDKETTRTDHSNGQWHQETTLKNEKNKMRKIKC
jgi:hypothetical protein